MLKRPSRKKVGIIKLADALQSTSSVRNFSPKEAPDAVVKLTGEKNLFATVIQSHPSFFPVFFFPHFFSILVIYRAHSKEA